MRLLCHETGRRLVVVKKNPLNKGIIMEGAAGIGTVTSEMVETRARELAAINGHGSAGPTEAEYEQAKRELTGEPDRIGQQRSWKRFRSRNVGNPCRAQLDGRRENPKEKMKTAKAGARARSFSKKG